MLALGGSPITLPQAAGPPWALPTAWSWLAPEHPVHPGLVLPG